jgi:hypothetical protein
MSLLHEIVIIIVLIFLNGFFAMSEISLRLPHLRFPVTLVGELPAEQTRMPEIKKSEENSWFINGGLLIQEFKVFLILTSYCRSSDMEHYRELRSRFLAIFHILDKHCLTSRRTGYYQKDYHILE